MSEQPSKPLAPMHAWVVCWWCGAVIADLALHNTRCVPPPDPEPGPAPAPDLTPAPEPVTESEGT